MEVMEFMSDATDIPILLDADTGYGNFNNARRMVTKLEQRGVAGACIEDKLFPKTNSLLDGRAQPLADIDEFCAKIRACKGTICIFVWGCACRQTKFSCILQPYTRLKTKNPYPIPDSLFSRNLVTITVQQKQNLPYIQQQLKHLIVNSQEPLSLLNSSSN